MEKSILLLIGTIYFRDIFADRQPRYGVNNTPDDIYRLSDWVEPPVIHIMCDSLPVPSLFAHCRMSLGEKNIWLARFFGNLKTVATQTTYWYLSKEVTAGTAPPY